MLQKLEICVQIKLPRCRIKNEIEAKHLPLHRLLIARHDHFVRAESLRVTRFAGRSREEHHLRSESVREFHGHMSESSQSDHPHLLAFTHLPMPHWRVRCNPCA